jgi:SAM-dependent methyltransferase
MGLHASDLHDFYETREGIRTRDILSIPIGNMLGDLKYKNVLALGYGVPYLELISPSQRTIAFMGARFGVHHWGSTTEPNIGKNQTALVHEDALPLPDQSIDVVMLIHSLEVSRTPDHLLQEVWRVLKGNGRLLIVVPNRGGLWARFDNTPFGHGHPYSLRQLKSMVRENQFTCLQTEYCLFMPPRGYRFWGAFDIPLEKFFRKVCPIVAGVLIMEASKDVLGVIPSLKRLWRPQFTHHLPK